MDAGQQSECSDDEGEISGLDVDAALDEAAAVLVKLKERLSERSNLPIVEKWMTSIDDLLRKSLSLPQTTIAVAGKHVLLPQKATAELCFLCNIFCFDRQETLGPESRVC